MTHDGVPALRCCAQSLLHWADATADGSTHSRRPAVLTHGLLVRYLDTCRHMKSCKYVHYEIDPADRHKLTELNKVRWVATTSRHTL